MNRKVYITLSNKLTEYADNLPSNIDRQSLVISLHKAYNLYTPENTIPISSISNHELISYHDKDFINHLMQIRDPDEELENDSKYGLVYDCHPFSNMREYVNLTASSSLSIANVIIELGSTVRPPIGINWYGGRHHCHRSKCAGYCYINDVVLCLNKLRRGLKGSIFYLDLDLHHGDGVENAFRFSQKIITCSVHRYDFGFYPGTGKECEHGTYNIPTKKGLNDEHMLWIITEIVIPLIKRSGTKCLVIQSGCDGLSTDEHKQWNMTIKGYSRVIETLVKTFDETPIILLGGGGYNHTETAKCWTYITGKLLKKPDIDSWDIIPEHSKLDSYEGDGYRFWTDANSSPGNMKDENDINYLEELKEGILNL